jgi:predicted AlkP superfamily pyrophosphatase or phosphodiesterase
MTSFRAGRAVILVLDALGPEAVASMAQLVRLAERGAMAPLGGLAELVASTGPGHATLLTGQSLAGHGVLANRIFDADGAVDRDPRVRVPTLMDRAGAAGRRVAMVASDPDILVTVNGRELDVSWPNATDIESHGYPKYLPDEATAEQLLAVVDAGHDLVIGHLQGIDTAVHAFGIDAPETRTARRVVDEIAGALADALADDWEDTLLAVVSDHRAEDLVSREPVRLAEALSGLAEILEDGSAALVRPHDGKLAAVLERAMGTAGVAGLSPIDGRHLAAWCEPGRAFGRDREIAMVGCHGNLTTRPCVAIVAGGHPAAVAAGVAIRRAPPPLRLWAGAAAAALAI